MSISGSCVIALAGSRIAPQTVQFEFTSEQIQLIRGFLTEAQKLQRSILANGGFPVSLSLRGSVGGEVAVTGVEPSDDQRAIYLHRIRPFQLQQEPFHFGKVKNALARGTASSEFMQAYLKGAADMFSGIAMQEQLRVTAAEAVVLNSDVAFTAWLNAVEYHRDETKMLALLKGRPLPNEDLSRRIFVMLLRAKVDAVLALGNIVFRLLSSMPAVSAPDA